MFIGPKPFCVRLKSSAESDRHFDIGDRFLTRSAVGRARARHENGGRLDSPRNRVNPSVPVRKPVRAIENSPRRKPWVLAPREESPWKGRKSVLTPLPGASPIPRPYPRLAPWAILSRPYGARPGSLTYTFMSRLYPFQTLPWIASLAVFAYLEGAWKSISRASRKRS